MQFLSLSRRHSSARNVPSGEERGETDVFAGLRLVGFRRFLGATYHYIFWQSYVFRFLTGGASHPIHPPPPSGSTPDNKEEQHALNVTGADLGEEPDPPYFLTKLRPPLPLSEGLDPPLCNILCSTVHKIKTNTNAPTVILHVL